MTPGLVIKLRPTTPWRTGSGSGAREQVEPAYHSDSLYSAVTSAMASLGVLEEWLDATARAPAGPAVRFSSAFPFLGDVLLIVPPKSVWPPAPSPRIRWKSARFVPTTLIELLLKRRTPDEDRWAVDGASGCLIPAGAQGPFRAAVRFRAAVDRLAGGVETHSAACLEFSPGAGLWLAAAFAGEPEKERWLGLVEAAFRWLADSGFGGERSSGWGRAETPEFLEGVFPDMIFPPATLAPPERAPHRGEAEQEAQPPAETAYWLLSLFAPGSADSVDWQRGVYGLLPRGGRVESAAGWGQVKKTLNMIEEGSVLLAGTPLKGSARDVAPDGFPHPVYRAGFALAVPVPWHAPVNQRTVAKPAPVPKPEPEAPPEPAAPAAGPETAAPPETPAAEPEAVPPPEAPAAEPEQAPGDEGPEKEAQ